MHFLGFETDGGTRDNRWLTEIPSGNEESIRRISKPPGHSVMLSRLSENLMEVLRSVSLSRPRDTIPVPSMRYRSMRDWGDSY